MDYYRPVPLLRAVAAVANEHNVGTTAASVAFYIFNTAIPLALVGFILLSYFGGIDLLGQAIELVVGENTSRLQAVVDTISDDPPGRVRALVIATAVLLWSAFRMFQSVDSSFAELYGERKDGSLLVTVCNTVLVLVAVTVGIGAVTFLPVYYVFPRVETSVRGVLPGTGFAAAGWTVSAVFFRVYLAYSANPYGLAGAVLLLLTWLYVGGLVLLLGGVLNAVLGRHVEVGFGWAPGTDEA